MNKVILLPLAALAMSQNVDAGEFLGSDVSAWVGAEHVSHDQDAVQLGVSLEWTNFTLEIAHGVKRTKWRTIDEPEWQMNEWQSGTNTALKWHPFDTGFFRPHIVWRHASDILRGSPFNNKNEPTSDFFGAGVTIEEKDQPIAFDVEYGYAARECAMFDCSSGSRTPELRLAIRVAFWK